MNSINRCIVRIFSLLVAPVLIATAIAALPARADAPLTVLYEGQTIRFTHIAQRSGAVAIGVNDAGFQMLLRRTGSILTWKPGERYVLITTSVPTVVSFAVGDRRYDVGAIALVARFSPYERDGEAYLPFDDVLSALNLAMRQDGNEEILQPQLAALDIRQQGDHVTLHAHGGAPLQARIAAESASETTYAFDGVGTTVTGRRQIDGGGVRSVAISSSGSVRNPTTLVTVEMAPGTIARPPQTIGGDVELSFSGAAARTSVAEELPSSQAVPAASPAAENAPTAYGPALVTAVTVAPSSQGAAVAIAISGNASYEWHRLRDPDNRFWIDISNAQLQGPPTEANEASPLISMRVRQGDRTTVRVALSLDGPKSIAVTPSETGLMIEIGNADVADAPRSGSGSVGSVLSSSEQATAPVTPAPIETSPASFGNADESNWKFAPHSNYVPSSPRLIVIDPGHGGSDPGTQHGGLREADLTLDMAKRLREILIARGWQVKLTRQTDVDVYAPNDSAHDELQARVDIANQNGARLFVSIHANAFINSGPYGTTYYISKTDDVALARIIEAHLSADGTKDDGVIKSHLYVTFHTRMPAVLIETAFLTNPSDYTLLASSAWRQKVAQEIADGIAQYAREYPVANQPTQ